MKKLLILFSIFYFHFFVILFAASNTISYQGRLRESGQPVSGTRSIQFRIFDAASAGTAVFNSDAQNLYVSSGIFTYQLGSTKAAGSPSFKDLSWNTSNYWLEISVGGSAMSPREQLNAVPYAFTASTAASLNGKGNIQITGAGNHYILNGNVGIGTMSPVGRLTINTGTSGVTANVNSMSAGTLIFANVASLQAVPGLMGKSDDHAGLFFGSGTNDANTSGDMLFNVRENDNTDFSTTSSPAFKFQRYGTDLITVLRNGNVGIGTTSPAGWFQIGGATLTVLSNGNIGIGTTDPGTYKLNIEGLYPFAVKTTADADTSAYVARFYRTNVGNGSMYVGFDAGAGRQYMQVDPNGDISWKATPDDTTWYIPLTTKANGRVGIGITNPSYTLHVNGNAGINTNLTVGGSVSKGSGSFDIPHPDPAMEKQGYRLRHYFVESPTAGDGLYTYEFEVKGGSFVYKLPGYFKFLNKNARVWVSPEGHFGRAYGKINEDYTELTITADTDGRYNVLVIGTRKDKIAQEDFDKYGIEYIKQK